MTRSSKARSFKPILEQLEDRLEPAFLLTGVVQQLATPLNNMVSDMNNAAADLKAQFALIKNNTAPANTDAGAQTAQMQAVADWQRILNDSAAIKTTVTNYVVLINGTALLELSQGDRTDAELLLFGPVIGFNPIKPLTDTVTQANNIVNDPTLQNIVNTNLNALNENIDSTTPISQVTVTPSF